MYKKILVVQRCLRDYRIPVFNHLVGRGYDVTVVHSGPQTSAETGREKKFKERLVEDSAWGGLHFQKKVLEIAENHEVAIVFFNFRWLSNLLLLLQGKCKVIWWGHGFGRSFPVRAFLARPLRVALSRAADALIVYDAESREQMRRWGMESSRTFVAHNTMHVPNHGYDSSARRRDFLFVGRLRWKKRIDDLLYAFGRVVPELPRRGRLVIVGEGEMRSELERAAQRQGIEDRVVFAGWVHDDSELKRLFEQSLAFVSPGHVGLSVLHSFAYGVPILTRRDVIHAPEATNIRDGVNGYLYKGGRQGLARRMLQLAQNPELSHELGQAAYIHYRQKRTVDVMVDGFEAAVRYVLQECGGRDARERL